MEKPASAATGRIAMKRYATIFALLLIAAAVGVWLATRPGPATESADPREPTPPSATSIQAIDTPPPPPAPQTLLDIVREKHPRFPTTQPLDFPVKFAESARLKLDLPLYIDPRGDLWITHPNADPISKAMTSAATQQTHIVPVPVAYVRWLADSVGTVRPWVVTRTDGTTGGFEVIGPGGARRPLPRADYLWLHAMDWQDATLVPTPTGVSVLRFQGELREQHFDFLAGGYLDRTPLPSPATQPTADAIDHPIPQLVEDTRGILAFIPWDGHHPGSTRIARYIDGEWQLIPAESEGEQVVHLIPLLDGSLIRLVRAGDGRIRLQLGSLDATIDVPRDRILALVDQLSDFDQQKRDAAMDALRQYGQGIWPILEEIVDDQPPEARIRIRQLLKDRIIPTLAGMSIIEDRLEVVSRQPDRTVLLYAPQGISRRSERDELSIVSPAWITTGPTTGIRLLDPRMTYEMNPPQAALQWVRGDWISCDRARGPRIWVGNEYLPLLDEQHAAYRFVQGVDRAGRWLFVREAPGPRSLPPRDVLLVDRHLPDPTPRLPVWVWSIPEGQVGWDRNGWPAMRSGGAYALEESAWRSLDVEKDGFFNDPSGAPSMTLPATSPAGDPALGRPLLVTPEGQAWYGGNDRLIVVNADASRIEWILPPSAAGEATPHLVQTADGRLYLYNQAGRIVRIAPTPGEDEPFTVEAVFTRHIPNVREIRRLWLDPAGRIILMADDQEMAILFPEGRIPRPIALLMPAGVEEEQW